MKGVTFRIADSRSRVVAMTVLAMGLLACGGGSKGAVSDPAPDSAEVDGPVEPGSGAEPELVPVEVDVRVTRRFGQLVRLDIKGVGRSFLAKQPFEDPNRWDVTAMAGDHMLTRAVNGPAQIIRDPVGADTGDRWDVQVSFWVAFNVPEHVPSMTVRVRAPGAAVFETDVELDWGVSESE